MSTISSENIISILRSEIENYEIEHEVGTVIWVGDGIATIYGMEHAMYGEIVIFENGVKGMVQDIKQTEIGCIILGKDTGIREGMKVTRTKKRAGIPVGEHYLGRVVNALGAPIDGKMGRAINEFNPELARLRDLDRTRVDRISGKDNDRHKVERLRVNNKDNKQTNDYRDVYGSHIERNAK